MKQCPQCNQPYSDDYMFCLSDGSPLVSDATEEVTLIKPLRNAQQVPKPVPQGFSKVFVYLAMGLLAIGLLVLLIGAGIVLLINSNKVVLSNVKSEVPSPTLNSTELKSNKEQERLNEEKSNLQEGQTLLEKEKQKIADERNKLEAQKNKPVESVAVNRIISPVQPTARIKFRRGSISETISSNIMTERNFVLAARSGQYLSATISSNNSCVTFRNGSTNVSYTTNSGDNYLSLTNNCNGGASFSLTILIR